MQQPSPRIVSGSTAVLGPTEEPAPNRIGPMRMSRSWNRWGAKEHQPRRDRRQAGAGARVGVGASASDDVAGQHQVATLGAAGHHRGRPGAGRRRELGLDFAEVDPPAADFHLIVAAPDEFQPAIGLAN